jgi:hypothetical protein
VFWGYKARSTNADIIEAVEKAVEDGVDIINAR